MKQSLILERHKPNDIFCLENTEEWALCSGFVELKFPALSTNLLKIKVTVSSHRLHRGKKIWVKMHRWQWKGGPYHPMMADGMYFSTGQFLRKFIPHEKDLEWIPLYVSIVPA